MYTKLEAVSELEKNSLKSIAPKIIVVEDDAIIGMNLISTLVNELKYEVVWAWPIFTGESALEKVGELHPNLILMDVSLAGKMDGLETAKIIIKKFNKIEIIFITGFNDEITRQKIAEINEGKTVYVLNKPYPTAALQKIIKKIFAK